MDVGEWLRDLGLGQYEEKFRDNKINAALLTRLTNDDLKDIGVSALGDRLQLLDAIAALASARPPVEVRVSQLEPAPPKGTSVSAERRPITVMFCDLVGSTSLAAKLDAEDWRTLVNTYLDEASAAVTGFGGHVLKKLGDGLMALFGYPQAQENDAERGVRAALAIQRVLAEINAKNAGKGAPELSARIGLESGRVVVDATGEVFGDAPNVAARVQATAEPGSVLITMNVQRQVAGLFVAEERGAQELKGVAKPVPLFRVVRASGAGASRRGASAHALRGTRGGTGPSRAPLGARADGRRPARHDYRRTGPRQDEAHRRVPCAPRRDAAHLGRVERFAAFAEHAASSARRMGTATFRWDGRACGEAPRRARKLPEAGED